MFAGHAQHTLIICLREESNSILSHRGSIASPTTLHHRPALHVPSANHKNLGRREAYYNSKVARAPAKALFQLQVFITRASWFVIDYANIWFFDDITWRTWNYNLVSYGPKLGHWDSQEVKPVHYRCALSGFVYCLDINPTITPIFHVICPSLIGNEPCGVIWDNESNTGAYTTLYETKFVHATHTTMISDIAGLSPKSAPKTVCQR